MKRLVIDDVRIMNFDCTYARNSEEGIADLFEPWDEVWFDHDLGGDDTIYPVILYIMETAFYGRILPLGKVVIHTDNPVGRAMIEQQLGRYYKVVHVNAADYRWRGNS